MKIKLLLVAGILGIGSLLSSKQNNNANLPLIAVASYGQHSSLNNTIKGLKEELAKNGFIENKTINFEILDVNFDSSLIPQMITKLISKKPKIMVAMSTPIAQFAKHSVTNIPVVFTVVTDPKEAGLLKENDKADEAMTGSSDRQNLKLMLKFAQQLLPKATKVGMLYSISESNDTALVKMMKEAASSLNIEVMAVPVSQVNDISLAMQNFRDKVDFIYVGTSGMIQPALPVIAAASDKMKIPVLNVDEGAVKDGYVIASFGVNYEKVGANTARQIISFLKGTKIFEITPLYPSAQEHRAFINKKKADELNITIPQIDNLEIVR